MPRGLGDVITAALTLVGITDDRVSKWLGKPCACPIYREKLNRLSSWARRSLKRIVLGNAKQSLTELEEILEDE